MSHPRCVYINNRCAYQSIAQQYLKICLIKDEVNYMFRPNVAIIRFTSESMVVLLYRIGKVFHVTYFKKGKMIKKKEGRSLDKQIGSYWA